MEKLKQILLNGSKLLEKTKNKYEIPYNILNEKYEQSKLDHMLDINDNNENNKILLLKLNNAKSKIDYISFIQKEINNITCFMETQPVEDFQYNCIYFGNNTLYYNKKLLEYTDEQVFDIILNHVFHYTGALYIINNSQMRLSYITAAMNICYGNDIDYKEGKDIYKIYKLNNIIFDIKPTYPQFIFRNKQHVNFLKKVIVNKYISYRIMLNNCIKLKEIDIYLDDNNLMEIHDNSKNNTFYSL